MSSQWFGGSGRKPGKDSGRSPERRNENSSNPPRGRQSSNSRSFQEPSRRVNSGRGFEFNDKSMADYDDTPSSGSRGQRGSGDWQQEQAPPPSGNGRQSPSGSQGYGASGSQGYSTSGSQGYGTSGSQGYSQGARNSQNRQGDNRQQDNGRPSSGARPGFSRPAPEPSRDYLVQASDEGEYYEGDDADQAEYEDQSENSALRKRAIALLVDVLACYMAAVVVMLVPFINKFLTVNLVLSLFLLVRDFFFEGRGIGKNVMGLQVVDSYSGAPCDLRQSVVRNAVLFAPYIILQVLTMVVKFIPSTVFNDVVMNALNLVGAVYVTIVIPLELYRVYSRADGLRLGDQFANTHIVEADMDFSTPVQRNR